MGIIGFSRSDVNIIQKVIVFYELRHLETEPGSLRKKRNRLLSLIKEKLRGLAEFQVNGHPEKSYENN